MFKGAMYADENSELPNGSVVRSIDVSEQVAPKSTVTHARRVSFLLVILSVSSTDLLQVTIDIKKVPGRTLGFSIAGGRGSTPAYEDVDDVSY